MKAGDYGFDWGPVSVTRRAELPRGHRVLGIDAGKNRLDVYVSPGGRVIRIIDWNTGKEIARVTGRGTKP